MEKFKNIMGWVLRIAIIAAIGIFIFNKIGPVKAFFAGGKKLEPGHNDSHMYERMIKSKGWDQEPSDIEGMTMQDKYDMGLSPYEGSDSDMDGLTDKEEIEVYHSDPLKASTADDMYLDGDKAANGMDIAKHYDLKGDFEFKTDNPDYVIFHPACAEDTWARAQIASKSLESYGYNVYAQYRIYNFSNTLSLNAALFNSLDIPMENAKVVILTPDGEVVRAKTTPNGSALDIDYVFNKNGMYDLAIVKSDSEISAGFNRRINAAKHYGDLDELVSGVIGDSDTPKALASLSCPLGQFFGVYNIYVNEAGYNDKQVLADMADFINSQLVRKDIAFIDDKEHIHVISDAEFDLKVKIMKSLLAPFAYPADGSDKPCQALYMFNTHDNIPQWQISEYRQDRDLKEKATWGRFDIAHEIFSFPNFGTELSPGGVCAGLASVIADKSNHAVTEVTGHYEFNKGTSEELIIGYDLTKDERDENRLLYNTDRELSRFENTDFGERVERYYGLVKDENGVSYIDPSTKDPGALTVGELEFINMINALWYSSNLNINEVSKPIIVHGGGYTAEGIQDVINFIDTPQVGEDGEKRYGVLNFAYCGLENGHCVNVYDYEYKAIYSDELAKTVKYEIDLEKHEYTTDDPRYNEIWFHVYDNNYPFQGSGFYLILRPYWTKDSGELCYSFDYEYHNGKDAPITIWSSNREGNLEYNVCFFTYDDEFAPIYGTEDDVVSFD